VREQQLPDLASTDWLILLLYVLGMIGLGVSMRSSIKSSRDYFQAGRSLPTWLCALAFIGAGLGAPEIIGMGAAGAGFGFRTALYFLLGGVPAMLFVSLFMIPIYYSSGAVTLPGYLGLRFDTKTRVLSAGLFIAMALTSVGVALYAVARIFEALRIFDRLFFAYGWPREGIFLVCILLAVVPVLIYVLIAGLRATIMGQFVQFVLLVAGFLPIVWTGLMNIGGWSGLSSSFAALASASTLRLGPASIAGMALTLGFVMGAARWTTDFSVLQMAMAAKCADSARRIPVVAAAVRLAVPFLFVLAGVIAISMPTQQSKTIVRNENGAIYHEITIVPRAISEGRGLVPALIDPATNDPRLDGAGHSLLDYSMATPNLLAHFAVTGLLGLAIAGLLASLMSRVASCLIAVSSVFTCDMYQPLLRQNASDANLLRIARWTVAACVLLSAGMAFAIAAFSGKNSAIAISACLVGIALVFALLQAPQLATYLLGVFFRRTSVHGAFAGLVAAVAVAFLHYGLTLPAGAQAGIQGGWLAVIYRYPGIPAQLGFTVVLSFFANFAVAWVVSLAGGAPQSTKLENLTYPPVTTKKAKSKWKRPEILAAGVMLITLVFALLFA
jgi:SSS family solute:Na+ symporter